MAVIYIAVRKSIGANYEIDVPDLPGCKAIAKICGDIQKVAREAITEYLTQLKETGKDFIYISAFKELVDLPGYYYDVAWHCLLNVDTCGLIVTSELH